MQQFFFIRIDGRHVKINFRDILYVEGCRNYLRIVTEKKNYLALLTFKRMEQLLPTNLFKRIHKSYIISLAAINEFDSTSAYLSNTTIPIGDYYKGVLEKSVMIAQEEVSEPAMVISSYSPALSMYRS